MKHTASAFFICLLTVNLAVGQEKNTQLGIESGINLTSFSGASFNLETDEERDYSEKKINQGFNLGLNFQHNFNSFFSLRTNIVWVRKIGEAGDSSPSGTHFTGSKITSLDYLTIPILAKVSFGNKIKVGAFAGPYFGLLLYSKTGSTISTSEYDPIEYGLEFGISSEIPISDKFMIEVLIKNQKGLKEIYGGLAEGVTTNSVLFNMGIAYKL